MTASRLMRLASDSNVTSTLHFDEATAVAMNRQLWGNVSPVIAAQTEAYAQEISTPRTPASRISPKVIF